MRKYADEFPQRSRLQPARAARRSRSVHASRLAALALGSLVATGGGALLAQDGAAVCPVTGAVLQGGSGGHAGPASAGHGANPAAASTAQDKAQDKPYGNRDWWPNQLDLGVLARNGSASPLGADFDYRKEFAKLDLAALKKDIAEVGGPPTTATTALS